jgi:hypothetical protein
LRTLEKGIGDDEVVWPILKRLRFAGVGGNETPLGLKMLRMIGLVGEDIVLEARRVASML